MGESRVCLNCSAVMTGRKRKYCDKWCETEYRRVLGGGAPRHVNCAICNKPLPKRGHAAKKYCSDKCSVKAKANNDKRSRLGRHPEKSCPGCNASFFPDTGRQTYCTRRCHYDSQLRVKREVAAIRRLGKKRKLPWRLCDMCGNLYRFGRHANGKRRYARTCSKGCQDELAAKVRSPEAMKRLADIRGSQLLGKRYTAPPTSPRIIGGCYKRHIKLGYRLKPCSTCGNVFLPSRASDSCCSADCNEQRIARNRELERQAAWDRKFRGRVYECPWCGVQYSPLRGWNGTKCCSDDCEAKYKRSLKSLCKNHRHRARRYGVEYHPIRKEEVFERDGWKCAACGCDTPKHLLGTNHDDEPNLDHIIPISQGGPHVADNLQCLCRTCNVLKGTMPMDSFMSQYFGAAESEPLYGD